MPQRNQKKRAPAANKEVPYKDDSGEQAYARVTKILGNGRVMCACEDGGEWQARVRGSMRRRQWVHTNDIVLACKRPYEDNKADIVHVYAAADVARMVRMGEMQKIKTGDDVAGAGSGDDDLVEFEIDDDDVDAL